MWNPFTKKRYPDQRVEDALAETETLLCTGPRSFTGLSESLGLSETWDLLLKVENAVTACCQEHHGRILSTFNGTVCAKFSTAPGALRAAWAAIQHSKIEFTSTQLLCGLHTGPVFSLGDRCFGSSINTAERIGGFGAQYSTSSPSTGVTVSGTTAALLPRAMPSGLKLLRLGEAHIKGVAGAIELFTVRSQEAAQTAFISYRRVGGAQTARLVSRRLQQRGVTTFLDIDDVGAKRFDDRIRRAIESSTNFVVVLSPGRLSQTRTDTDWLREEVSLALRLKKNIIPLLVDGFAFPDAKQLPPELAELPLYNAISYSHDYFDASLDRVIDFLI